MTQDKLYFNGNILSMDESAPFLQAVLVRNGHIIAAGDNADVCAAADPDVKKIDLQGKTLLPSFIDPHSHITSFANALLHCSLASAKNFEEIIHLLQQHMAAKKTMPGQWVVGLGYDHNNLEEQVHPTKALLDAAAPNNPVVIAHASGHMGVANSLALQAMGITAQTKDPAGGRIGRMEGSQTPSGYLEENAFIQNQKVIPGPTQEELLQSLERAQNIYLQYGITLAQDGLTRQGEWQLLLAAQQNKRLSIDIVAYADLKNCPNLLNDNAQWLSPEQRLSFGGYKIFLDGSPQGRTAWMSQPYANSTDGYCGYPIYRDEEVTSLVSVALREHRQILAHCNGDAAAEQYLNAVSVATQQTGQTPVRPVMIHAQLVRPDQLQRMAALSMIPSFFVAHTYHWGDIHYENFGPERAAAISPAKTALEYGLPFTFHQDTPVIAPDMLETVWCAVNRTTKHGRLLGAQQRLSPWEALKAVTIYAAYQYGQEKRRGSISVGKLADFVVLSHNPLTTPPEKLRDIQVLATIKEGETLYSRQNDSCK